MKPLTPLQKRNERRNRNQSMVDMNLVSLIDVFTILIFFLMSNVGVETISSTRAVQLPESMSQKPPKETVMVVVTGTEILVGGKVVAAVKDALTVEGDLIQPLKAELDIEASREVILKENDLKLEVVVRHDKIEVGDKIGDLFFTIPNNPDGPDLATLNVDMFTVKNKFPAVTSASVLSEPNIFYDTVIYVMDAMRTGKSANGGTEVVDVDLFPVISIGDAPVRH